MLLSHERTSSSFGFLDCGHLCELKQLWLQVTASDNGNCNVAAAQTGKSHQFNEMAQGATHTHFSPKLSRINLRPQKWNKLERY